MKTSSPPTQGAARLARLWDKIALGVSRSKRVDGLWIGCFYTERFTQAFHRVEEALDLIKVHDRLRYDRLLGDLDRVWVTLVPGALGRFRDSLKACELDERFVLADTTHPEHIASAIVHEATHARLMRCGIGYETELRARVEAVCLRREIAFAANLPNGEEIRARAERNLTGFTADSWSNEAFRDRYDRGAADAMQYVGIPGFLVRGIFAFRALLRRAMYLARCASRLFPR